MSRWPRGFFVTGTDTGVGKTRVACALLHALNAAGACAVGMKPVAAGATRDAQGLLNEDVAALMAASAVAMPRDVVNPYCFEPAIAPHIAAATEGVRIEMETIARAFDVITGAADTVVVEGAGGFCIPLGDDCDSAGLAVRLGLPVILVVGLRLGCLNHALLTAEAIHHRGLPLAGWVANQIDPAMPVVEANISALSRRLPAPLLARVGFAAEEGPQMCASRFDLSALLR